MLVGELEAAVDRADRQRLAAPQFLDELRALVRRYERSRATAAPPATRMLVDRFTDGEFTSNPAWRVARGNFWVNSRAELRTRVAVTAPPPATRKSGKEELPLAILGAILNQGAPRPRRNPGRSERAAEIYLPYRIAGTFDIRLTLRSAARGGRLRFGVYRGSDRRAGYDLVDRSGAGNALELVEQRFAGDVVLARHPGRLELDDGRAHRLRWQRDRDGKQTVSMDGVFLLQARDGGGGGGFDGIRIVNAGGDYAFGEVRVE